jgi:rubrerythrin
MKTKSLSKNKTADGQVALTGLLRQWQGIEDHSVESTTHIIQQTKNPFIKLLMEIIRQDSVMHKKVQQFIIDSLEKEAVTLTPEDVAEIWESIERHAAMEKETIDLAEKAQKQCRLFVPNQLLTYLIEDEHLHDRLLSQLEDFKRKMYSNG